LVGISNHRYRAAPNAKSKLASASAHQSTTWRVADKHGKPIAKLSSAKSIGSGVIGKMAWPAGEATSVSNIKWK